MWMGSRYLIPRRQKPPFQLRMSPMQGPIFLQAPRAPNLESSCLPRVLLRHPLGIPALNPTVNTPPSLLFLSPFPFSSAFSYSISRLVMSSPDCSTMAFGHRY